MYRLFLDGEVVCSWDLRRGEKGVGKMDGMEWDGMGGG